MYIQAITISNGATSLIERSYIRSHSEVSNRSHERNSSRDIMKDPIATRDSEAHADEDESRDNHDGRDGPVPIGAMGGDVDIG